MQGQSKQEDKTKQERLQKIANQLKTKMNYNVLDIQAGNGSFGDIMFVNDGYYDLAVKIINIYDGVDSISEHLLEEAKQEARILSECNHFHIVRYHSEFQIGNNYFIVMEKCDMSLSDWIEKNKNNPINPQLFTKFALEILKAVQFLHSKKYVLRDLSLKNILIDKNLTIKLCDFGLAKKIDTSLASQAFLSSKVKGALFYLPPEILEISSKNQNQKVEQTREADIWALGICLYALSGAQFMKIMSYTQGIQDYQHQQQLGTEINEILIKILRRKPQERLQISVAIESFLKLSDPKKLISQHQDQINVLNLKSEQDFINQGDEYCNKNMTKYAKLCYKQALQIDQNSYFANNKLGNVFLDEKKFDKALKCYNLAIQIDSTLPNAISNKGLLNYRQQNYKEAINLYKQALSRNYYFHQTHYNLGLAYEKMNMLMDAENSFQIAIQIYPNQNYIDDLNSLQKLMSSNQKK